MSVQAVQNTGPAVSTGNRAGKQAQPADDFLSILNQVSEKGQRNAGKAQQTATDSTQQEPAAESASQKESTKEDIRKAASAKTEEASKGDRPAESLSKPADDREDEVDAGAGQAASDQLEALLMLLQAMGIQNPQELLDQVVQGEDGGSGQQDFKAVQVLMQALGRSGAQDPQAAVQLSGLLEQAVQQLQTIQEASVEGNTYREAVSPQAVTEAAKETVSQIPAAVQLKSVADGMTGDGSTAGNAVEQAEVLKQQARVLPQQSAQEGSANKNSTQDEGNQTTTGVRLEELQQKVDSGSYLDAGRMISGTLQNTYGINKNMAAADSTSVLDQVKTGLEQGMQKGLQEFTIKLKPEGLGEITVHLASAGGKIALSIGVSNEETQRLLNSEMMNLKELLKPYDAHVQEVYHSESGSLDMNTYQQNMFQQQRQMASQIFNRQNGRGIWTYADEEEAVTEEIVQLQYDSGELNTYI